MVAARAVDLLLGTLESALVDEKLVENDRFDDLTTSDVFGRRERVQFKHTDVDSQVLSPPTFSNDSRKLRLDKLLACAVADRDGPGCTAASVGFRVVLRDGRPTDDALLRFLKPASRDPGPFLPGMSSYRLRFDAKEIWPAEDPLEIDAALAPSPFAFLRSTPGMNRDDFIWFCERLVIEVEAPAMSGDLGNPNAAELVLLDRIVREIGAGQFPNELRHPVDVAEALVSTAHMARDGLIQLSAAALLRRTRLRSDFGTVSQRDPVEPAVEVKRSVAIAKIAAVAAELVQDAKPMVIKGPPGQGKSWTCKQLVDHLRHEGWLVAEHYCFLGVADNERDMRVYTENIFGTLLNLLAEANPALRQNLRPKFAVSQATLEDAVKECSQARPNRPVALIVDGLDHVSRVAQPSRASDASRQLAEVLAALNMPKGSILIVLSQPGEHLSPLLENGAREVQVVEFAQDEIAQLVIKHGITTEDLNSETSLDEVVDAIYRRSRGNALYATYLCRELRSRGGPIVEALASVNSLPVYDGSLKSYYQHLCETLGTEAEWVADYLAFLDFPVTPSELGDIQPDREHHVRSALKVLWPVLDSQAPEGGVRIYHESFARFLVDRFEHTNDRPVTAINSRIANWLNTKGMLEDERAYRFLLPALKRAGRHSEVLKLIDGDFLTQSVASGFPATFILSNLTAAIGSAAQLDDWPAVVRCIELARGASTFEYERFEMVMGAFADVSMAMIGGDKIASRLLVEGQPVVPVRTGLKVCAALDEGGVSAPWEPYVETFIREDALDNTSYESESNAEVYTAFLRGQLRILVTSHAGPTESQDRGGESTAGWTGPPESLDLLVEYIDQGNLPADRVARAVLDTQGPAGAMEVARRVAKPASFALAVAGQLQAAGYTDSPIFIEFRELAMRPDRPPGSVRALLGLGASIDALLKGKRLKKRPQLLKLTEEVQHPLDYDQAVDLWFDLCVLAAIDDPIGLATAEAAIDGDFWYRNWLRFTIHVARAEAAEERSRSDLSLRAIKLLNANTDPFAGKPRACDLYRVWGHVRESIRRAVDLLDDSTWHEALKIIASMSASISTTVQGEFGGPFASDDLLHLVVETGATPARREVASDLIETVMSERSSRRFYTDLALFRLVAARLALRSDDLDGTMDYWVEACQLLSGYGYRRDLTIFELLDPLSVLIGADPLRGRDRVAVAQPFVERILAHTDGKETRAASPIWWSHLALADPLALATHIGSAMVARCNLPGVQRDKTRDYLWKTWQLEADPVLASLLRNTLDLTIRSEDAAGLKRLLSSATRPRELDAQIASLADESEVHSSDSSDAERSHRALTEFNAVVYGWNAPRTSQFLPDDIPTTEVPIDSRMISPIAHPRVAWADPPIDIPVGAPGIAHAARAWQRHNHGGIRQMDQAVRFANAIGYRLIDLIQHGHFSDAYLSIWSVADADRYRSNQNLLRVIAEGLERMGHSDLAAVAYALCWTRSRGGGGWLTFGGETEINALRQALKLNRDATLMVIAEETQRAAKRGEFGVTQAIIYAFAVADMPTPEGMTALDVAFQCWDEAAFIIDLRTPRVHASDDPDEPYTPSISKDGAPYPGELDLAYALAIIAGISNPGREQKRRSVLSVRMLLEHAPKAAGQALQQLLPVTSDPATLVWILRLIETSKNRSALVAQCGSAIANLVVSDYLVVRTLARRLLIPVGLKSNLPMTSPDTSLLEGGGSASNLWLPPNQRNVAEVSDNVFARELERVAGTRLTRGEVFLPRFQQAVLHRFSEAVKDGQFRRRIRLQADAIGRINGWPNAYLAPEEAIESALQRTAGGGRLAKLANGEGILGAEWEEQLAIAVMDDPLESLDLEAVRYPRPPIAIPPGQNAPEWINIMQYLAGDTEASSFDYAYSWDELEIVVGTKIGTPADGATIIGGRFDGWRVIGSEERRIITSPADRDLRLVNQRYGGLEYRVSGDKTGFSVPPFSSADSQFWAIALPPNAIARPIVNSQPLIACDLKMTRYGDAAHGLGIPERIMVPTGWLRALWRLEPLAPYLLGDQQGEALALVTWRAEYTRSDYHLPWAKLQGSAIVVRPDLLHRLQSTHGEQLVLRDFISGPTLMIKPAT